MPSFLTIHGIGAQAPGFSEPLRRRVVKRLGGDVTWVEARWAQVLEPFQAQVASTLRQRGAWFDRLRGFMQSFAGDATVYHRREVYREVQDIIDTAYEVAALSEEPVVHAHSLGTVVASDWLWDTHPPVPRFVTTGSPIPMFLGGLEEPRPPQVPRWINVWSKADVISHPLGIISEEYARAVVDIHRLVGSWPVRYTPLAHNHYDKDARVIDLIAGVGPGLSD